MEHGTQRVRLQRAFVLHTRPYRESSLLVEAFTYEFGRVALVARGARRPKSALRSTLQAFHPLLLSWQAKSELATLVGAEADGVASTKGGRGMMSGLYLNELLLRFLHRSDPHPDLFERYGLTLTRLDDAATLECALRVFEKHMLDAVGYGLELETQADSGEPVVAEHFYSYRAERGAVPYEGQRDGVHVSGHTLLALAAGQLSEPHHLREAKRLMRSVIRAHLGDRPLETHKLFARLASSH